MNTRATRASSSVDEDSSELDAAAILLSLKTTAPSFPRHFPSETPNVKPEKASTTGYIPIYDWTQAIPSLSYAGNTYNINLQMYNSPVRLVPVPLNEQNSNCLQEMSVAFVKFCQIHRDTIFLHNTSLSADRINEKLVNLWTQLPDDEKVVYSKVAKNELLLMQGKDISSSHVKVEANTSQNQKIYPQDRCSPSLFRHPMFAAQPPDQPKYHSPEKNVPAKHQMKHSKSPVKNRNIKNTKQRSLSLSDKPVHRIYIRRAVSQEEVSEKNKFAKPTTPDHPNKKYFIRMRRHSMNDSILNSAIEKINPYFTKNYTKSPLKTRNEYSKTKNWTPKRNLSVTSLDIDQSSIKSPPKRNKGFPTEADIFDFKSEPHGLQAKAESEEEEYSADDVRKTETYSYSLLKGASKTSSVNPCFSSRKMFVKKFNAIPTKCVNRIKQEYCKKGKHAPEALNTTCTKQTGTGCRQQAADTTSYSPDNCSQQHKKPTKHKYDDSHHLKQERQHRNHVQDTNTSHRGVTADRKVVTSQQSVSPTSSDVTMVTSSSMESLKSTSSSSSSESKKVELLNDSVLISHAIAELENAEESRLKGSRRSHALGSLGISDVRYRHVCSFFREHGLNPSQERISEFYNAHRDIFSCKPAALLTIREVRQKIIKLQLM